MNFKSEIKMAIRYLHGRGIVVTKVSDLKELKDPSGLESKAFKLTLEGNIALYFRKYNNEKYYILRFAKDLRNKKVKEFCKALGTHKNSKIVII